MKVYGSNAIRNVAFVGHGASGKTSLVDALAWVSGSSRRHGGIKDGTTLTDYSPDEIARQHSINLALGYAEWMDTKINLIDTPGYLDYFGEVVTGLHAADAAVVVVSGTGGVEVGTERAWEVLDQLHLPRAIFVSLMDKEHADFERVFADVQAHLTPKVVPVEIPIGDGPDFHGIINLFSGHCHLYKKGALKGENEVVPIPDEYQARYQEYSEHLTEAVASTDDDLIERYLSGEEIPRDQFIGAVKQAILAGQIVPLFYDRNDDGVPHPVTILHANADETPRALSTLPIAGTAGGVKIGYWFWELSHFPLSLTDRFGHLDEVWAPSRF